MGYSLWKENSKIKLMIIVGTRSEIIRLATVIKKYRKYFDTILVHTGQNYDFLFVRDRCRTSLYPDLSYGNGKHLQG